MINQRAVFLYKIFQQIMIYVMNVLHNILYLHHSFETVIAIGIKVHDENESIHVRNCICEVEQSGSSVGS